MLFLALVRAVLQGSEGSLESNDLPHSFGEIHAF
jgi:hypothetical protein